MIFLKAIGIALGILSLLFALFVGLISLVAGLCAELEHEQADDEETLGESEKEEDDE